MAYEARLQEHEGERLRNAITEIGKIFGVSEGWMGFWVGTILLLMVGGAVYGTTRNAAAAMLVGVPVIAGFAWIGLGTTWLNIFGILLVLVAIFFGILWILGKFA